MSDNAAASKLSRIFAEWRARLPLEISLAFALGFVLALLGPYDTYQFPLLPRGGYWIGLIAAWFLATGLVNAGLRLGALATRLPSTVMMIVTYLITAVPMTALVWVASVELTSGTEVMYPLVLYGQTLLIGTGASLVGHALFSRPVDVSGFPTTDPARTSLFDEENADPPSLIASRLEARLPIHLRGAIMVLASEDHYVRVYTSSGSHILLMRLSDAMEEIDGLPGARVHRSWWVAASAPCEFQPRGRTAILRVKDMVDVPVSTPYLKIAEELAAGPA